ncbi:hypothetical protein HNR53_004111 [Bacillus benzoevorans]|uniref:Uncharacterized protein n=1 Tax=Bacillus benzoevorans TaxID=1456 RepID=A0A7X0LWT7_9BACI|nr:hypothetical protein [Bacillus benzoevorans]
MLLIHKPPYVHGLAQDVLTSMFATGCGGI